MMIRDSRIPLDGKLTPKEYLQQVRDLNNLINTHLASVEDLRSKVTNISKELTADRVQGGESHDFTDVIAKIYDLEIDISKEIDKLVNLRTVIEHEIRGLDSNIQALVLINHYILGKSLIDISEEYMYGSSYIKKVHGWALEAFREKYAEKFD